MPIAPAPARPALRQSVPPPRRSGAHPALPIGLARCPAMPASRPARLRAYLLLTASMALVGSYVALSKPLVAVLPVLASAC